MNRKVLVLGVLLAACAVSRPEFVEPRWGDAPPPLPTEVTEITQTRRVCSASSCRDERIVLRRDGWASRDYGFRHTIDSSFVARMDSLVFLRLAEALRAHNFFTGSDDDGALQPLASASTVISVATLCRRKTMEWNNDDVTVNIKADLATAVASLQWSRCCHY
jgi:hypothetical protein